MSAFICSISTPVSHSSTSTLATQRVQRSRNTHALPQSISIPTSTARNTRTLACCSTNSMSDLDCALDAFREGKPIMIFDAEDREGETDIIYPADTITPAAVRHLRQDCGGLVFMALAYEMAELFGLPYIQELFDEPEVIKKCPVLADAKMNDLKYDAKSTFSLWVNHRKTYTGITDRDRALTASRLAQLGAELMNKGIKAGAQSRKLFGQEFRTPGHIPVCREAKGGVLSRKGHTELAVAIARMSHAPALATLGAEMLQPNGDLALQRKEARQYARDHGIPMVEGLEIVERFEKWVRKQGTKN